MAADENLLAKVRMLVTDLDGTIMARRPEFELYQAFQQKIDAFHSARDTIWCICTGRSLRSFTHVFLAMRSFGIAPDYVITKHAYIFQKKEQGYAPHWVWNAQIRSLQTRHLMRVRRVTPRLSRMFASKIPAPFVRTTHMDRERACFRFNDTELAATAAETLREKTRGLRYLQIFHYGNEVDVRVIPFTKGLAVAELARHLSIPPSQILVIGDGHNDLSMMEVNAPCYTGCPGNAVPEIIETVHRAGGTSPPAAAWAA